AFWHLSVSSRFPLKAQTEGLSHAFRCIHREGAGVFSEGHG
ncbi:unnamed protein product, partial [Phaeothamnion confervicola]